MYDGIKVENVFSFNDEVDGTRSSVVEDGLRSLFAGTGVAKARVMSGSMYASFMVLKFVL